jgi:hypothetical protein
MLQQFPLIGPERGLTAEGEPTSDVHPDLWVCQQAFYGRCQSIGGLRGSVSGYHFALPIDKKFGEVPADCSRTDEAKGPGLLLLKEAKKRVSVGTVHVGLCEEREGDAVVLLAKDADSLVAARFLGPELVAWEGKHFKTATAVRAIEGFKTGLLWREAAQAGDPG